VAPFKKSVRSLAGIAGIVAIATLISKVMGLVRQQAIAAVFGTGPVADAYNFAYVIPGFLLVLLGGINGPFHSAMVSVLSRRDKEEAAPLVETITTLLGVLLLLVTLVLFIFAEPLLDLVAPGLSRSPEGLQARAIAVQQLRVMAPMALLAGLIGIGFGTLNAADHYWLPSLSPALSSITVLLALGILGFGLGDQILAPEFALMGGLALAWGTLAGALLQWLVQLPAQGQACLGRLRLRFEVQRPGVQEVLKIMGPATFSSGMLQINVYTDLFFASFIPQAASALGYASLLALTPLGILSNMILVPFLPIFSRLANPIHWPALKDRIRQALMFTAIAMLPLGALAIALAKPIVRLVYERFNFDQGATTLVASVLIPYGLGMFVYLGRDILVRVFYALGDGNTPFRISLINIVLNGVLDYGLSQAFGAPGLVLATVGVNIISMGLMLWLLHQRLNGLPLVAWSQPLLGLGLCSVAAGIVAWGVHWGTQQLWVTPGILVQLLQFILASGGGLGVFILLASQLQLPELNLFLDRLRQRLIP